MRFRYLINATAWCLLLTMSQADIHGQSDAPVEEPDPLFEQLTEHSAVRCNDFIYNAKLLIPRLHREGKLDSLDIVLDYIENACGIDSFWPLRDLLRVEAGTYPENPCDGGFLKMILGQQWGRWSFFDYRVYPPPWLSDFKVVLDSVENQYQLFQSDLIDGLISSTDSNSVAHLAVRYYSGDRTYIIARLRRDEFSGTCLQESYWQEFSDVKRRLWEKRVHLASCLGAWFPMDSVSTLGPKMEFGGQLGIRHNRIGFDLTVLIRFLKSKNEYAIMYQDTLRWTDHFLGGMIGGEITFELFHLKRLIIETMAGVAYDGFESYKDGSDKDRHESVNAFNVNFGLTPRLFINKERNRFLGLQFRYNIVDYVTHGGSDLSGNTLSVNLVYGYMGNIFATDRAKELHLYD